MHALKSLDSTPSSDASTEQSIDAIVTKKLLETVQLKEVKRWNHKIESLVLKKLLPDLVEKFSSINSQEGYIQKSVERALKHVKLLYKDKIALETDEHAIVPRMIQNCVETDKNQSTFDVYQKALLEAKTLCGLFSNVQEDKAEERVAKAIFSIGQHVCTTKGPKTPFEKMETLDYLILEQQFDLLSSYEIFSYETLKQKIYQRLKTTEAIAEMDHLPVLIASVHAKKLALAIDFEKKWGRKNLDALKKFVSKQIDLEKNMHPIELVNRILFLYHVSGQKDKKAQIVEAASDYLTSLSTDLYSPSLHRLGHEVYLFINNEIRKIKSMRPLTTLKEILLEVQQMFSFVDDVVNIPPNQKDLLEIFVFSHFFEHHPIRNQMQGDHVEILSRHLAKTAIEKGAKEFRQTVHTTYDRIVRYKKLQIPSPLEDNFFREETLIDKISHFASQNELVLDLWRAPLDHPLYKIVKKNLLKEEIHPLSFDEKEQIVSKFLQGSPLLEGYRQFYVEEVEFFSKIHWYTSPKKGQKTPFERFYQWHYEQLKSKHPTMKGRDLIKKMEELTTKTLPLMPSYRMQAAAV